MKSVVPFELKFNENALQHPDFSNYWFTDHGRVYSTSANNFVGFNNATNGLRQVKMHQGNKSKLVYVHNTIMELFGQPQPSPEHLVQHIDKNINNNNIVNLAWGLDFENPNNNFHKRITKSDVKNVKEWYQNNYERLQDISPRMLSKMALHELGITISGDCIRINRSNWENEF